MGRLPPSSRESLAMRFPVSDTLLTKENADA